MNVAKTKALISSTVTVQLICAFVFSYAKKTGFLMKRLIWTSIIIIPELSPNTSSRRNKVRI